MPIYDARSVSGPSAFFRYAFGQMERFDPGREAMARGQKQVAAVGQEVQRRRQQSIEAAATGGGTRQAKARSETRAWNEAKAKMRRLGVTEPSAPEEPDLPEAGGVGIEELSDQAPVDEERARLESQYLADLDAYNRASHVYEAQIRELATQLRRPGVTLTDEQAKELLASARERLLAPTQVPAGARAPTGPRVREDMRTRIPEDLPDAPSVPQGQEVPPTTTAPSPAGQQRPTREALDRAIERARAAGAGQPGDDQPADVPAAVDRNPIRDAAGARLTKDTIEKASTTPISPIDQLSATQVLTQLSEGRMDPEAVTDPDLIAEMADKVQTDPAARKAYRATADAVRKEIGRESGLDPAQPLSRGDRERLHAQTMDRLASIYPAEVIVAGWKAQIKKAMKTAEGREKKALRDEIRRIGEAEESIRRRRRTIMPTTAGDLAMAVAPDPTPEDVAAEMRERSYKEVVPGIEYRSGVDSPEQMARGITALRTKVAREKRDQVKAMAKRAKEGDTQAQHQILGLMLGPDSPVRERFEAAGAPGTYPTIPVANQILGGEGLRRLTHGDREERKTAAMRMYAYAKRMEAYAGGYGLVGERSPQQQITATLPSLQPLVGALRVAGIKVPRLSPAERRIALKRYGNEFDKYLESQAR